MPTTGTGTSKRAFVRGLAIIALAGLAVRLVYVLGFRRDYVVGGDPDAYHDGANLLVHGKGVRRPFHL